MFHFIFFFFRLNFYYFHLQANKLRKNVEKKSRAHIATEIQMIMKQYYYI